MSSESLDGQLVAAGESQSHHQKARVGRIPPPPFIPGSVRLSAVDHIATYRETFRSHHDAIEGVYGSGSQVVDDMVSMPNDPTQIAMHRKLVQGLLLTDLRRLLNAILYLESLLIAGQDRTWMVHTFIAVGFHIFFENHYTLDFIRRIYRVNVPSFVPYLAYPVAIAQIANADRQIKHTVRIREELEDLYHLVQRGEGLQNNDVRCVSKERFDRVPWQKLERVFE